jgi:hypothetical protein
MEQQRKNRGLSRGKQMAIALSALVVLVLFFGAMAAFLMEPDATFYVRDRASHSRIPITREQGLAVWVPLLALLAVTAVCFFWHGLRHTWRTAQPAAVAPELPLGETVLWFGRPGWRSFRGFRILVALAVIVVPALLVRWMWSIVVGPDVLSLKLFLLLLPVWILFCFVVPPILYGSDAMKSWLWEVFGGVAITRARIVWLTPIKRRIYRTIAAADIVDVCLTDSDGQRGSVTVIKRRGRDNVENAYLDWLPEPEKAYATVQALITYRSPA